MPTLTVQLLEGRDAAMLERLAEALTETVCTTLGSRPEAVQVVLQEVPKTHWFSAGKSYAKK